MCVSSTSSCKTIFKIFKQRYIAGSAKCSSKPISKLLTCILSAVKTGLQSYCDTSYSRGGVNQMWILKSSKDFLEYIQSRSLSSCNIIKIFDLSTLYTTIPHSNLKNKLRELVQLCFIKKNDIFNRLQFLIENIFVMFGGRVFQQSVAYL